jgi:DHA1 family multidrug resistance protein-like MFS transporter
MHFAVREQGEKFVLEIRQTDIKQGIFWGFLVVVALVELVKMGLIMMLLPSMFVGLDYSRIMLGWVMSANLLADNLFKSATGWFVDRKGPWPVLLLGCLTVFAGLIVLGLGIRHHLWMVVIAAALIGIGGSPAWPAAIAGTINIKGESKRAATISLISIFWMVGGGLGVFLVGLIIGAHPQNHSVQSTLTLLQLYQQALVLLFGVATVTIVITFLGWYFNKKMVQWEQRFDQRSERSFAAAFNHLKQVWNLTPGMFFQTFSLGMLMPNLLPFTIQQIGFTELQYYCLLLCGGAVVVVFMNPVGRLIDRLGPRGFLIGGFLLAALALIVMVSGGNPVSIWFIVACLGFSYALIQPAWNGILAASIPPSQRGALMGLFMSIEGLGFALGPIFGGWLSEARLGGWLGRIGIGLPFYVSSCFLVIMAVVYTFHPLHHYNTEE